MKNKTIYISRVALIQCLFFISGFSMLSGQEDYPGLSIYSPTYYEWTTNDAQVTTYEKDRFISPESLPASSFVEGGATPEAAAKICWSALSKANYTQITINPDTSSIKFPDFEGLKKYYTYNVKYKLINKTQFNLSSGTYCYIQYQVSSDANPNGIDGVIITKRNNNRWFNYTEDPLRGYPLVMIFTEPTQLKKIFTGEFKNDNRFSMIYEPQSSTVNITNFIQIFKTWFNENGEIQPNMDDILKYPNWKR